MSKNEMVAMAKCKACRGCKNKSCDFKGKTVKGYTIHTTENCVKENRTQAIEIVSSKQYKEFIELLNNYNASGVEVFKKHLSHIEGIALNELE